MELIVASDSRLRSRGAIDQCQKLLLLTRGDCFLSFCGDTQITYPLFLQVGSTLNNFIKTRTRATDVFDVANKIAGVINALVSSWDLPKADRNKELQETRVLFGGWSWRAQKFDIGVFSFTDGRCEYRRSKFRVGHPWYERHRSLVFIGDYEAEFRAALTALLEKRFATHKSLHRRYVDFDYEPVEALNELLKSSKASGLPLIGGAPQLAKIYPYGNSLPLVTKTSDNEFFLYGRKLFSWEKSELPILDLTKSTPKPLYPMAHIPSLSGVTKSRT